MPHTLHTKKDRFVSYAKYHCIGFWYSFQTVKVKIASSSKSSVNECTQQAANQNRIIQLIKKRSYPCYNILCVMEISGKTTTMERKCRNCVAFCHKQTKRPLSPTMSAIVLCQAFISYMSIAFHGFCYCHFSIHTDNNASNENSEKLLHR